VMIDARAADSDAASAGQHAGNCQTADRDSR
jgi:hypothetical protein